MTDDKINTYYKKFLKYYHSTIITILAILSVFNYSWLPRGVCYIGISIGIASWIWIYIDYTLYHKEYEEGDNHNK